MFAKRRDDVARRTFRDAVARLDPAEAFDLAKALIRSRLPLDSRDIQALLDRGMEARDESTADGARIWAGWYRAGYRIKSAIISTKIVAGDALILAETARDVETDPGIKEAADRFDRSPKPE